MEDIRKIFTIQWVGPFDTFDSLNEYLNDTETCDKTLFSFYYCSGSKKGKGHPVASNDYRYFGLRKAETAINKRVNRRHEHLSDFREPFALWVGSFSDCKQQTKENTEIVETMFISTYKDFLSENDKKKKARLKESTCVINLWYKRDETRWGIKKPEVKVFDDVLVYEHETDIFSKGNLSRLSITG